MKMYVDKMPESGRECPFGTNSTGKWRCRLDAKLCPIVRGGDCEHLTEMRQNVAIGDAEKSVFPPIEDEVPKRSRAKKSKQE